MIRKKYIYDFLTRFLHAGIGGSAILLIITANLAKFFHENSVIRHNFWMVHVSLGFLLSTFLILRFIWLFIGPKYSKISNFIQVKNWKEIIKTRTVKWKWGHHPFAGLVYIGVYATVGYLTYSGHYLSRIQYDMGPISPQHFDDMNLFAGFIESHEFASCLIVIFIIVHLAALFWHQQNDGVSVLSSMKDGFQHKYIDENNEGNGDNNEDN